MNKVIKEIESLRTIAVFAVVLYHAKLSFLKGGFIGVDIFFVISGFLITKNIIESINKNEFCLFDFYERRARRLLPALYFVIIVTTPFAFYWMLPDDLENFGQSLVATVLYSNNILLFLTSGYWGGDNDLKPLLHTWSLGVEEQYYMALPFILLMSRKFNIIKIILPMLFMSYFSYVLLQEKYENFAFFMLPTRFWELSVGSMAAIMVTKYPEVIKRQTGTILHEIYLGIALATLVIFCLFPLQDQYGMKALILLPVLSTAYIILYSGSSNFVGTLLRARPLVAFGGLSYAFYLVHQPMFAIGRHASLENPTPLDYSILVILSIVTSYFIKNWIEQPFRNRGAISTVLFIKLFAIITAMILAVGLILHYTSGLYYLQISDKSDSTLFRQSENINFNEDVMRIDKSLFPDNGAFNFLIVGNSFGRDFVNMTRESIDPSKINISYLRRLNTCARDLHKSSIEHTIIDKANIIFYASIPNGDHCLKDDIKYFASINKRFYLVGPKNFGASISAIAKLSQTERFSHRVKVIPDVVEKDILMRSMVSADQYISLIDLMSEGTGKVPVYTDRQLLISFDREHLTKDGARFLGQMFYNRHPVGKQIWAELSELR